jgi:hypothetical protein
MFAKTAKRMGKALDKNKIAEPVLRMGLEFTLLAFFDLDTERDHGNGWQRIPWTSILQYAYHYELGDEQCERFIKTLQSMDHAHIERLEEKRKAEEEMRKK